MDEHQSGRHMEAEKPTQQKDVGTSHAQPGTEISTIQPDQLNTNHSGDAQGWRRSHQRRSSREIFIKDLYNAGYDQETPRSGDLNHVPFSSWTVTHPSQANESVSDLRLITAISILFSPGFGIAALVQACRAQDEAQKGNITRAKELNSTALGLAIGGIAISIFVGVAVAVQQFMLYK